MLDVQGLRKTFHDAARGPVVAVDGLSFRVEPGEVYGLLGPNGAGKTTTLRILATLEAPDSGSIRVDGVDPAANALEVRRRMAYVPAESGLPERLTGRETVRLFAAVQGVKDAHRAADALIEQLGAAPYADTPCGDLSTGMKRRIVLARALVHGPQVLMLDEPTDGLDVPGRRQVLDLIKAQARAGRTVILSSHIMGEVERVVDRLGVMTRGKLAVEGPIARILQTFAAGNLDDAFLAAIEAPS